MRDYLVGPVRAALRTWDRVLGLVVGSYHNPKASTTGQHSSEAVHTLALEAVEARARTQWRLMGARSEQREDPHLGVSCTSCGAAGAASSGGRGRASSAVRARLPAVGRSDAEILWHGPPPAFARGQGAAGGLRRHATMHAWPQVDPAVVRGSRAAADL